MIDKKLKNKFEKYCRLARHPLTRIGALRDKKDYYFILTNHDGYMIYSVNINNEDPCNWFEIFTCPIKNEIEMIKTLNDFLFRIEFNAKLNT